MTLISYVLNKYIFESNIYYFTSSLNTLFPPGCPFYWQSIIVIVYYDSLYFSGIYCNFFLISDFIDLIPLLFFA